MIIVKLSGGLGNQLFQYAYGRHIAWKSGVELKLDLRKFGKKAHGRKYALAPFCLQASIAAPAECRELKFDSSGLYGKLFAHVLQRFCKTKNGHRASPHYFKQRWSGFRPEAIDVEAPAYLDGHWESELYFADAAHLVRQDLRFAREPDDRNQAVLAAIDSCNAVSIHVRRTDFLVARGGAHDVCTLDYYRRAVRFVCARVLDPVFFVFSDDIGWCREHLQLDQDNVTFVDVNDGASAHEDLRLMSRCKHNITANSTFSWWGSWLNAYPDKIVISPQAWQTKDILTEGQVAL